MISVVAGVLRDGSGRILLSERLPGKHLAGTWEFPGGKLEADESAHAGLARELEEELGVVIERSAPLLSLTHAYPEKTVRLLLREVDSWQGEPRGKEGQALRWAAIDEFDGLPMPAADRPMIKTLGLDPRYAISPDPATCAGLDGFVERWHDCLRAGFRLLQLRAHSVDETTLAALARRCGELARDYGARWLLNGPVELALACEADGIHLTSQALLRHEERPLPESLLLAASCHNVTELAQAGRIGADLVCVSPVRSSKSHPGNPGLGWAAFAELVRQSPLPVLALGGLSPVDLSLAREHGAFGVAGISGFGPA